MSWMKDYLAQRMVNNLHRESIHQKEIGRGDHRKHFIAKKMKEGYSIDESIEAYDKFVSELKEEITKEKNNGPKDGNSEAGSDSGAKAQEERATEAPRHEDHPANDRERSEA